MTDLPFQIVITGELEGDEYAAYRILKEKADIKDIEIFLAGQENEKNPEVKEGYFKLMEFVEEKNPGITRKIVGGDKTMASIFFDVFKPEIDEHDRNNLFEYVQDGDMSIECAARRSNMTQDEFRAEMAKNGYREPQLA
ncbi:MAG: hypothetical protein IJ608_01235 [Lachnospiraceae bacterium]|nr:hypothetical protein [Lachnospiraceae bacterium]